MTMITLERELAVVIEPSGASDELSHIFCCQDEDTALCGTDLTNDERDDSAETTCRLCLEADEYECDDLCSVQAILDLKAQR